MGALQSLHMPLSGAGEVFGALDVDGSGYVDIRGFCDAMIGPAAAQPRLATRKAGSEIVMSGRQPSGDRCERATPTPPAERGYTPTRLQPVPRGGGGGSNGGSRTGS